MKHVLQTGREPNFQKILITSAVIHLVFITLIVVPLKKREDEYRSYFVNLVSPVESPRKPAGVQSPAVRNEPPQKSVKQQQKPAVSLEEEQKVSKEIARIRAVSSLSKLKEKRETEKAREIEVIRRSIQESSTKESGIPGSVQSLSADSYYGIITRKIWSEWIYPEADSEGLEVVIGIRIDRSGNIISHEIERSSGNSLFDRSAIKAVTKSSPLPPPPYEMEIGVRFYL